MIKNSIKVSMTVFDSRSASVMACWSKADTMARQKNEVLGTVGGELGKCAKSHVISLGNVLKETFASEEKRAAQTQRYHCSCFSDKLSGQRI
jgi:hypothetical protein